MASNKGNTKQQKTNGNTTKQAPRTHSPKAGPKRISTTGGIKGGPKKNKGIANGGSLFQGINQDRRRQQANDTLATLAGKIPGYPKTLKAIEFILDQYVDAPAGTTPIRYAIEKFEKDYPIKLTVGQMMMAKHAFKDELAAHPA